LRRIVSKEHGFEKEKSNFGFGKSVGENLKRNNPTKMLALKPKSLYPAKMVKEYI